MSKKLSVIIICSDSPDLAKECISYIKGTTTSEITDVVLFDNGSQEPLPSLGADKVIRSEKNLGMGMPIFYSLDKLDSEYLAFFHVDLRVVESNWDKNVINFFETEARLGLIGFVGSKIIDSLGGRGYIYHTHLNFQGNDYQTLTGSPAEKHGTRFSGFMHVANLDGCALIFRKSYLQELPSYDVSGYPPAHYYDVAVCCEMISRGYIVGLYGAACDHSGGGIGTCKLGGEQKGLINRDNAYREWLLFHGYVPEEDLNTQIYLIARKVFLNKWHTMLPYIKDEQ